MPKRSKKYKNIVEQYNKSQTLSLEDAVAFLKEHPGANFDESIDVAIRLGVDPKHAEQIVRGTVVLPHGIGKTKRVLVFAAGEKEREAQEAGADVVGGEELVEKIAKDKAIDFDVAVATPDLMSKVGRLGKILGPRGLMPNPKSGTVTFDVKRTVEELKAGKIEYRVDKTGIIHLVVGRRSFDKEKLVENLSSVFESIIRARPTAAKGRYLKSITLSTTMGPGIKVDTVQVSNLYR